jgi:DNA invertase Pin-like site-specific DNA recombinase
MVYGYIRVSSKSQVEGTGLDRQETNIKSFCKVSKLSIDDIVADNGVSGTIENREGITKLLSLTKRGDVVVFEKLDRLARDLMVQETIIKQFQSKGVVLKSVKDGEELLDEKPERIMIRQILGAVYQYDKSQIVEKLKVARDRIRKDTGKCEGRKSTKEKNPELLSLIRSLYRKPRQGERLSFSQISTRLNEMGMTTLTGRPFTRNNVYEVIKNNP